MSISELAVKISVRNAEKTKADIRSVSGEMNKAGDAAKHMGSEMKNAGRGVIDLGVQIVNMSAQMLTFATGVGAASAALTAFATHGAFETAAKMDSLTRGLASVSTGVDDLAGQLDRLQEVAKLPGLGFAEAVQGSIALQSAGLSAGLAERSLRAFGNALASVGKGKSELDGVTLALEQMASKGKISAEEISQIGERVPQIRAAMQAAFGTADTEALQKMNLGTTQFIDGIVGQLERLPAVTGGVGNALENLGDRWQQVMLPFGQGLAEGFMASTPYIERMMGGLEHISTSIGETMAAVARSGALADVLDKVTGSVEALTGLDFSNGLTSTISTVLSVVGNLPQAFIQARTYAHDLFENLSHDAGVIGTYISGAFGAISNNVSIVAGYVWETMKTLGRNMVTVGTYIAERAEAMWTRFSGAITGVLSLAAKAAAPIAQLVGGPLQLLTKALEFEGKGYLSMLNQMERIRERVLLGKEMPFPQLEGFQSWGGYLTESNQKFVDVPALPKRSAFEGLPQMPEWVNLLGDRDRYAQMIAANRQPLSMIPEGLNYAATAAGAMAGPAALAVDLMPKEGGTMDVMERIERNTRDTADALSLRRQTLGGGSAAAVGVTPAELNGGPTRGATPGLTRGQIGKDSSIGGIARSLEYYVKRRIQESNQVRGGYLPRTG